MTRTHRVAIAIPLLVSCVTVSSCVLLRSSTISDRSGNGQSVSARLGDYGIVRLTVPEHLTPDVNSKLVAQCPSGMLTNVRTELSMREFFASDGICVAIDMEAVCPKNTKRPRLA